MSRRKKPRPEHAFIIHRQAVWSTGRDPSGWAMTREDGKRPKLYKAHDIVWVLALRKDKAAEWEFESTDAADPDAGFKIRIATKNLTGKPQAKKRIDSRDIMHKVYIGRISPHSGSAPVMRMAEIHKDWLERFSGWPF
jgi:hypothetical protein